MPFVSLIHINWLDYQGTVWNKSAKSHIKSAIQPRLTHQSSQMQGCRCKYGAGILS